MSPLKPVPEGLQPISDVRRSQRLTQGELARVIRERQWTVSRIECGWIVPNQAQLSRLCKALKVKPADLFTKEVLAEVARRSKKKVAA